MVFAASPPPPPPAWNGPHPLLTQSPIYLEPNGMPPPIPGRTNPLVPIDNRAAVQRLLDAMRSDFAAFARWLVVVPGTSEVDCQGNPGHHVRYCAQPGEDPAVDVVSPEFRARLDHAHALLRAGHTAAICISGGSVDLADPTWCEALEGLRYLLARYAGEWPGGELRERILVDPWALHTECNVRNGERIAILLGLDRCTFVTTRGTGAISTDQGQLFESPAFDLYFRPNFIRTIGFNPGRFAHAGADRDGVWDTNGMTGVDFPTRAFDAWEFDADGLTLDDLWATAGNETFASLTAFRASVRERAKREMDPVQRAWVHAHHNVDREFDMPLSVVTGEVPADLRGVFLHNGPGRLRRRGIEYGHLFDGDGMLLRFEFGDAGIRYCNRFVHTREYLDESRADAILYRGFGTEIPGGVLANAFRMRFKNAANTSVIEHGGAVLALWEGGLPHRINPGTLEVLDRYDYGGKLLDRSFPNVLINPERPFSAHPKIDPATGELFSYGIVMGKKQTLLLYRVAPDGRMDDPRTIELDASTYVHDFTITSRYMVVFLSPLNSDSLSIVLGLSPPVRAMSFDVTRPLVVLLVPRDGGPVIRANAPAAFVLHFANAFDDTDGTVVVDGLRLPGFPKIPDLLTGAFDPNDNPEAFLTRFVIDPRQGSVAEKRLCDHPIELPTIHPAKRAARHRYVYGICIEQPGADPIYTGLVKVDTETGATIYREFAPNITAEPLFVPRPGGSDEDDGWILTPLYVESVHRSVLYILDARDMSPLCVAPLPHHVPPGFHGTFLRA